MSTHILSDLQKLADDITMIKKGRIVYTGTKTADIEKTYEDYFIEKGKELFELQNILLSRKLENYINSILEKSDKKIG